MDLEEDSGGKLLAEGIASLKKHLIAGSWSTLPIGRNSGPDRLQIKH